MKRNKKKINLLDTIDFLIHGYETIHSNYECILKYLTLNWSIPILIL